jgi:predicted nucleic acid-binding protein
VILVDTSVWIDHLRATDAALAGSLERGLICMHPFVLGEIACGNLRNRREVLDLLARLPAASVATDSETLEFIERRSLMGRGIGNVDVHLLASAALGGTTRLWTRDRRLALVADELGLAFETAR